MIVLAPASVQECVDMVYEAFDFAERDDNPVLVLTDGVLGTMMEPVVLPDLKSDEEVKALKEARAFKSAIGHKLGEKVSVMPGSIGTGQEAKNIAAAALYESWEKDIRVEEFMTEDAELILTAYGISARISRNVVKQLRAEGVKAGLIRPQTLSPFPYKTFEALDFDRVKGILDVEMSIPAQMKWDVEYAVKGRCPIGECLRSGGQLMTKEKVLAEVRAFAKEVL